MVAVRKDPKSDPVRPSQTFEIFKNARPGKNGPVAPAALVDRQAPQFMRIQTSCSFITVFWGFKVIQSYSRLNFFCPTEDRPGCPGGTGGTHLPSTTGFPLGIARHPPGPSETHEYARNLFRHHRLALGVFATWRLGVKKLARRHAHTRPVNVRVSPRCRTQGFWWPSASGGRPQEPPVRPGQTFEILKFRHAESIHQSRCRLTSILIMNESCSGSVKKPLTDARQSDVSTPNACSGGKES